MKAAGKDVLWTKAPLGPWLKVFRVHGSSHHQTCFTLQGTHPSYFPHNVLEGRPLNTHGQPTSTHPEGEWCLALQWPPALQALSPGLSVAAWASGLSSTPHSPTHMAMGTRN